MRAKESGKSKEGFEGSVRTLAFILSESERHWNRGTCLDLISLLRDNSGYYYGNRLRRGSVY